MSHLNRITTRQGPVSNRLIAGGSTLHRGPGPSGGWRRETIRVVGSWTMAAAIVPQLRILGGQARPLYH